MVVGARAGRAVRAPERHAFCDILTSPTEFTRDVRSSRQKLWCNRVQRPKSVCPYKILVAQVRADETFYDGSEARQDRGQQVSR